MKKLEYVLVGAVAVLLLTAIPMSASGEQVEENDGNLRAYVSHAVIKINSDSELQSMASSGSGTVDDPYIIENYEIDANGGGYAIYIGNTTKYFVIRNLLLYNASYSSIPYNAGAGVILYNVINGKVENVNSNNNSYGIYVRDSSGNIVNGNTAENNSNYGIWVVYSDNVNVTYNTCTDNGKSGILLYNSQSNLIEGNTCIDNSNGISLWSYSNNTQIKFNTLSFNSEDGIYMSGPTGNYINGTLLYKNTFYNNTYGVQTYNVQNMTVRENEGYNNTNYGIYLNTGSSYNTLEKNHMHDNLKSGIYIYTYSTSTPSDHNVIMWNNLSFNGGQGLYLDKSSYNDIHNNMFYNNSGYGITIYSSSNYNRVYENSFYFNHGSTDIYSSGAVQAADYGTGNAWNISYEGNFWYDWTTPDNDNNGIVDNPYSIDGSANSEDELPLTTSTAVPELSPGIVLVFVLLAGAMIAVRRKL